VGKTSPPKRNFQIKEEFETPIQHNPKRIKVESHGQGATKKPDEIEELKVYL
jgi:hypothetical protein